jgi:hypothetical protein
VKPHLEPENAVGEKFLQGGSLGTLGEGEKESAGSTMPASVETEIGLPLMKRGHDHGSSPSEGRSRQKRRGRDDGDMLEAKNIPSPKAAVATTSKLVDKTRRVGNKVGAKKIPQPKSPPKVSVATALAQPMEICEKPKTKLVDRMKTREGKTKSQGPKNG